jgi:transglutaminase-like putative cysteine protease
MRFRITHVTKYTYAGIVSLTHNIVRMRPRNHDLQSCVWHEMSVSPAPSNRSDGVDYFGNHTSYFSLQESHRQLAITARSEVEMSARGAVDVSHGSSWEQVREILLHESDSRTVSAREFSFDSPYASRSPELARYALPSFEEGKPFLQCVLGLTERIHRDFEFLPGSTRIGTPVLDVLRNRKGVCQDFAHLQIGCLRSLGVAARYVSGYLLTTPPPGQPRLAGADVSHAWVSVFSPEAGWVDFDPTNGLMPSDSHITVAWARDYDDLGPIRGILVGGRRQRLQVSVDVVPVEVAPTGVGPTGVPPTEVPS